MPLRAGFGVSQFQRVQSGHLGCVVSGRVPWARGHQPFYAFDGLDATAGADGGAVEGGGGAGEIKLAGQGPTLQEAVDEAGVKNVSGSGGVNGLDAEGGGVVELRSIPGEDTFFAEGGGGEAGAKTFLEGGQGFSQIGFLRQTFRDIPAGDEIVDSLQERFHTGVEFIHVGDDGNVGAARPACGGGCSGGIVSIDVKGAGVHDPVPLKFFGAQRQALVAFPKNSAFAGVVDKDKSLLAGTAGRDEKMSLHAKTRKFGAVQFGGAVVADSADVARAQAPLLAGNHGGGHLSAKQDFRRVEFDFGAALGIVCDGDESVGGVKAHTDYVNL